MKKFILILSLITIFASSSFANAWEDAFAAVAPEWYSYAPYAYNKYGIINTTFYGVVPTGHPLNTFWFEYTPGNISKGYMYYKYSSSVYYLVSQSYIQRSTTPTCTPPAVFSPQNGCSTPTCQGGYTLQSDNTCKPDVNCPSSMDYHFKKMAWYQFDVKECVPSNKNKADCLASGGDYIPSSNSDEFKDLFKKSKITAINAQFAQSISGHSCSNFKYMNAKFLNNHISAVVGFNPYGTLATKSDLLGGFINKLFGWGKNKLFSVGKNFWSSINKVMPSGKGLNEIQPDIINMDVGDDGVTYEVTPTPKTPTPPDGGTWLDVYNNYTNAGGKFPDAPEGSIDGTKDVSDFQINRPSFFVNPSPDTYYNGNDAISFKDNNIITSNMITDNLLPNNIDRHFDDAPNVPFDTSYTVKPDFLKNKTAVSYPAKFVKTKMERIGTNQIQRTFKGTVTMPDNSITNVKLISTTNADGTVTQDTTVAYPVETENGNKIFHNNYVVNKSASGEITSSFRNPSNISHVDDSGAVVTTTNSDFNSAPTTEETKPVIDLSGVNSKLDAIKDDLDVIDADIKDGLEFEPDNAEIGKSTITDFGTASDLFDVNFHTYLNFLNGIKQNMSDLHTQFIDTKALLENKPVVKQINGTCGFNTTLYFTQIHVDPCAFVLPYRPILSMFFTLFATFGVLMFGIKFSLLGGK